QRSLHYSERWRSRTAPPPVRPCRTRGRSCFSVSCVLHLLPQVSSVMERSQADVSALTFCPSHHPPTRSTRNIVSSQVFDRSSWRTRYVLPSVPFSLKYR